MQAVHSYPNVSLVLIFIYLNVKDKIGKTMNCEHQARQNTAKNFPIVLIILRRRRHIKFININIVSEIHNATLYMDAY